MSDKPKMNFLQGQDVVNMLTLIYLDGFSSGVATAVTASGASEEIADRVAQVMTEAMQNDPATMLVLEGQVTARLGGSDGSNTVPMNHQVYGKGKS